MELEEIFSQELDTAMRESAFQHWTMTCNRDAAEVGRRMGIAEKIIKRWEQEDEWALRAKRFMVDIDEDMQVKMRTNLAFGADEGIQYMRDVAGGRQEPNKDRLWAANQLAYMAGFAPNTNNRPEPKRKPGKAVSPQAIQAMSEADVRELEAAIQEKHAMDNKEAFDKATRRK